MHPIETLEIQKLNPQATLPTRAYPDDAGLDLYSAEDAVIGPQMGGMIGTGIALAVPQRHVGMVCDRSSMAKKGLKTAGGIIDAGYRGEVKIIVWNLSKELIEVKRGERIAQLLILPIQTPAVREVSALSEAARGAKGFGSSGK